MAEAASGRAEYLLTHAKYVEVQNPFGKVAFRVSGGIPLPKRLLDQNSAWKCLLDGLLDLLAVRGEEEVVSKRFGLHRLDHLGDLLLDLVTYPLPEQELEGPDMDAGHMMLVDLGCPLRTQGDHVLFQALDQPALGDLLSLQAAQAPVVVVGSAQLVLGDPDVSARLLSFVDFHDLRAGNRFVGHILGQGPVVGELGLADLGAIVLPDHPQGDALFAAEHDSRDDVPEPVAHASGGVDGQPVEGLNDRQHDALPAILGSFSRTPPGTLVQGDVVPDVSLDEPAALLGTEFAQEHVVGLLDHVPIGVVVLAQEVRASDPERPMGEDRVLFELGVEVRTDARFLEPRPLGQEVLVAWVGVAVGDMDEAGHVEVTTSDDLLRSGIPTLLGRVGVIVEPDEVGIIDMLDQDPHGGVLVAVVGRLDQDRDLLGVQAIPQPVDGLLTAGVGANDDPQIAGLVREQDDVLDGGNGDVGVVAVGTDQDFEHDLPTTVPEFQDSCAVSETEQEIHIIIDLFIIRDTWSSWSPITINSLQRLPWPSKVEAPQIRSLRSPLNCWWRCPAQIAAKCVPAR